jgi:ATP-dependent exoDNAse (exonuclease V) alpha subunit
VVRLTEVFRQAAASRIIVNAHRINAGEIPDLRKPEGGSDFYFVPADDPETAVPRIIELVQTRIPGRFGFNSIRSEYPVVVIPVMTQHYTMLQRNLLYTGITRGRKLVVLVGQKKAVAIAVRNVSGRRRWSKLTECLEWWSRAQ